MENLSDIEPSGYVVFDATYWDKSRREWRLGVQPLPITDVTVAPPGSVVIPPESVDALRWVLIAATELAQDGTCERPALAPSISTVYEALDAAVLSPSPEPQPETSERACQCSCHLWGGAHIVPCCDRALRVTGPSPLLKDSKQ